MKIIKFCGTLVDWAVEGSSFLAGSVLLIIAFITTYEVFSRYVLNSPTNWTLDLSIYLLIWFGYSSIAYLQKHGRHVRVDLLISLFPPRTKEIWEFFTTIVFFIFIVAMIYYVTGYTLSSFKSREYGWAMWRVLIWPVKAAMPFGTILLGACLIKDIIAQSSKISIFHDRSSKSGLLNKPFLLLAMFFLAIAISIYLYTINGAIGMISLMLVLLIAGVPIFPALGITGVMGIYLVMGGEAAVASSFPGVSYTSLENFALVCLPLFVFVGQAISSSGISEEIYDATTKWVGHFPGGESIATILACSIFAAVSVSSVATATTIGLIAIPALLARNYNRSFSYGLLAAGGTLGIMIPPSGTMIIYSAVTEESLGKLFMAGVIPGILLALCFIAYSLYYCKRTGEYDRRLPASWNERWEATKKALWGLSAPVIILGGIYSGIFTPLEAGAIAAVYVLLMLILRRKIRAKQIFKVLSDSTFASTMVLSIIVGALLLGEFMTLTKIPDKVMELVMAMKLSPWGVMVILMLFYIILGMFLEVVSIMLITLPTVYPLIIKLGFDGIWFAVMITLNMEMALITPPVGLNLYAIKGIAETNLSYVLKGVWPFFIIMLGFMVFLAIFPSLSTWLPQIAVAKR